MVGLRTHVSFFGAFCMAASELIKILPVCDKGCQEHLIFNKYTQATRNAPKKTSPQHRNPNTNDRLSHQRTTSMPRVPLTKGIVDSQNTTITVISNVPSSSQGSKGEKHSRIQQDIPHVAKVSTAVRNVQQFTVSKSSVKQSRSPSITRILSLPSSSIQQVVHKRPINATLTSSMLANLHVQRVAPECMQSAFRTMTTGNLQNKNTKKSVLKVVHAKQVPETCKKNNTSLEKRFHNMAAATSVAKSTTAPLGELVNLFARALTEILDKESRSGKCIRQKKNSLSSTSGNASVRDISAKTCLNMPVQKIGAIEQGIRALQWRLQKLEVASANAHPIQYIVPQYYPYLYTPYYAGESYSNPSPVQQIGQVQGTSLGKSVEKESVKSNDAKQNVTSHIEQQNENDIDAATISTLNSEMETETDEETDDVESNADSLNKETTHGRGSKKTSYEIRGKDAWDQVLSDTKKALFRRLRGEVVDLKGGSEMIGGFSFVGSKDTEGATPASLESKMHRKRSGWIDDEKWAQAAAMSQTVYPEYIHPYLPNEELNLSMPFHEEKMHTDNAYNMSQKNSTFLEQFRKNDETQSTVRSDKVDNMIGSINQTSLSHNAIRKRPLYQNLEKLGYKEPAKGVSMLELIRKREDVSSEEDNASPKRSHDSSSDDNVSHSESAEYVYLSDLIRLCSRSQ